MTATYNMTIRQGATFTRVFTRKDGNGDPIDLTGFTAHLQMRKHVDSATPFVELTSEDNGGITLGGAAGTIALNISAEDTSNIVINSGVYDLKLISEDEVIRVLEGSITVSKQVTV